MKNMRVIFDEGTKMLRPEQFHITLFRIEESVVDYREVFEKYKTY